MERITKSLYLAGQFMELFAAMPASPEVEAKRAEKLKHLILVALGGE